MKKNVKYIQIAKLLFFLFSLFGCQLISLKKEPIKPPLKTKEEAEKEESKKVEKPKIGLFISGAGANTFSVVPILELFQKQNLHFDFISGTGWGAWLAAVYAKNQSAEELKWNLFKLKEKGVFGTRWFNNKRKRVKILKALTKEILPSSLSTPFVCPALSKQGKILWFTGNKPTQALFNCLNRLPPLFFFFNKSGIQGSLFSVKPTFTYIQNSGINTLIWLKPSLSTKNFKQDPVFSIFWKELFTHLNTIQKKYLQNTEKNHQKIQTIILETKKSTFSLYDFSHLNTIMKKSLPLSTTEKVYRLKRIMNP